MNNKKKEKKSRFKSYRKLKDSSCLSRICTILHEVLKITLERSQFELDVSIIIYYL